MFVSVKTVFHPEGTDRQDYNTALQGDHTRLSRTSFLAT